MVLQRMALNTYVRSTLVYISLQESELMQEKRCLEVQRRAQKDNSEMQTRRPLIQNLDKATPRR